MAGTSASIDIEYTEELVCAAGVTLIRRSDLSGNLTFIGSNGVVVAAPAAYTIGACVSATADLEAVDFCMRVNTAGVGYAIGDQIKLTRWFNTATNTQVSEVAFNMTQGGTNVAVPLTAANFDECPSASGANETIVCDAGVSLIRRVDAVTGAITFIGSNGAAVAVPAAYTIGACVTDLEAVEFCLRANTAGAGYAIGDQVKLTRWFNPTTNVQVSEVAFNTTQGGSAVTTPLVAANFDECTVAQISLTVETYRLSGGAVGASTASTAPASVPVVGNTLTINGPYRSLSWRWLRQTSQDPGTGLVAKLIVNGFEYYPGSGPQYQEVGQSLQTSENQTFSTIYTFTASGAAFVELVVVR